MMDPARIRELQRIDREHVWHPFTPMRQWRASDPILIEAGEGDELIDVHGNRYVDGVSSLWCNVHGHRVPELDRAIRDQLDRIAHSTMLGLANVPATELAERLVRLTPGPLRHVFYSDSGATATEVAFKMAVGHFFHRGEPQRNTFVAFRGAYHGDTTGAMSIGYSDTFHRPFRSMVFHTEFVPPPDVAGEAAKAGASAAADGRRTWPLEQEAAAKRARDESLSALDAKLRSLPDRVAAVVIEPLVQGAAGMLVQPPGFVAGVAAICRKHGVLLIADEVATGFGRTGRLFACEHEGVEPDLLCLGKGITGGYLPIAATLCSAAIAESFEGELHEMKTLFHGHTYTGNPLGCAVAVASIDLLDSTDRLAEARAKAERLREGLDPLRDGGRYPFVADVRQCGLMAGIELAEPGAGPGGSWLLGSADDEEGGGTELGDFGEAAPDAAGRIPRRLAYEVCAACLPRGVFVRPLGNVIVVMPPLTITDAHLRQLTDALRDTIADLE
jgi:adenosylmethionine-8-amino-7-oxononanoate aminotransferase